MSAAESSPSESFFASKLTMRHLLTRGRLFGVGIAVATAIFVIALGTGAFGSGEETVASPEGPRPLPVDVVLIEPVDSFQSERTYTGTLAARRSSTLAFERAARVTALLVDEGDLVAAGQELARLDVRHLDAREQELTALKAAAAATLAELIAGPRVETIAATRAEVAEWNAQYELSQRTLKRTQQLRSRAAVGEQALDDARFAMETAKARLDATRKRLEELEAGTRSEQIVAQRSRVDQLEASLADLRFDREDSVLRAPYAGRIAERAIDEGTVVSPGQVVFRITESSVLEARVGLPPSAVAQLSPGQTVSVRVGSQRVQATLARIRPELNSQTRTRVAIFELAENPNGALAPGQIVQVPVTETTAGDGFWLPTTALTPGDRGLWVASAVVSVDGHDTVEARPVEILHTDGERVLVRGTLRAGDRIISSGVQRIVPGQRVKVVAR